MKTKKVKKPMKVKKTKKSKDFKQTPVDVQLGPKYVCDMG